MDFGEEGSAKVIKVVTQPKRLGGLKSKSAMVNKYNEIKSTLLHNSGLVKSMLKGIEKMGYDCKIVKVYDRWGWVLYRIAKEDIWFSSQSVYDSPEKAVEEAFDYLYNNRRL